MPHTLSSLGSNPFTLADFKAHIRLETDDDDAQAQFILNAAMFAVERWTGRMLRSATVEQRTDNAMPPFRAEIAIPTSIGTIIHTNAETDATTDVTSEFYLARMHGWWYACLRPRTYERRDGYYTWTYAASNPQLSDDLKICVFGIGATWYENREQVAQNINLSKLPIAYRSILESFRDGML